MPIHKHMACILSTIVDGEDLPALGYMQFQKLCKLLGDIKADACPLPPVLILVVGQVHVQAMLRGGLELIALAGVSKLAVRIEARARVCRHHEASYAREPERGKVAKDGAQQGKVMQGSGQLG